MRFRVDMASEPGELAWEHVFGPARAVAYSLIRGQDQKLATELHDRGWRQQPLVPLGMSCPQFQGAPRVRGRYTISSSGSLWLGSPVPEIAGALLAGLAHSEQIRWGPVSFTVRGVQIEEPQSLGNGEVCLTTATPVLVKHEDRFVTAEDSAYVERLHHNLAHKADVLGLPRAFDLEILDAGPVRHFLVGRSPRIGTTLTVRLAADPQLVQAVHAWGLGLYNNQGFGWVR